MRSKSPGATCPKRSEASLPPWRGGSIRPKAPPQPVRDPNRVGELLLLDRGTGGRVPLVQHPARQLTASLGGVWPGPAP